MANLNWKFCPFSLIIIKGLESNRNDRLCIDQYRLYTDILSVRKMAHPHFGIVLTKKISSYFSVYNLSIDSNGHRSSNHNHYHFIIIYIHSIVEWIKLSYPFGFSNNNNNNDTTKQTIDNDDRWLDIQRLKKLPTFDWLNWFDWMIVNQANQVQKK